MEFGCSICEYTSKKKDNVIQHFKRKKSCGSGIKEVIEIPAEISCEFCDKNFSCATSLQYHIKNSCKEKDKVLKEEIRKLKEENKLLRERPTTVNNNTVNINLTVNNYSDTDLTKLTDKTYNKIIKDAEEAYRIIPNLIKHLHFNPKIPENHNVYLSNRNKNNKYLQVYKDKHWETINKTAEIDNLINDKETNISDWIGEKGEKYPEAAEKYNEYLEQKYDEDTAKLIKEEVELVLYNGRHMIKNT